MAPRKYKLAGKQPGLSRVKQLQQEQIEMACLKQVRDHLRLEGTIGGQDAGKILAGGLLGSDNIALYELVSDQIAKKIEEYNELAALANQPLIIDPVSSKKRMLDLLFGLGKLQPLLDDPNIEEIMINRFDRIFVVAQGQYLETNLFFRDDSEVLELIKNAAAAVDRRIDPSSPMLDLELPGGDRLNGVIPPIARQVSVTIRKYNKKIISLESQVELGTLTTEAATFLWWCLEAGLSMVISGGTASGKTTFLNCLAAELNPRTTRVVVLEQTRELRISEFLSNSVSLQTREANAEGAGVVTLGQLVRNSLRMRPDRIIVGEVRYSEALDMLLALSSGHSGLSTVHAESAPAAISRLASLASLGDVNISRQVTNDLIGDAIQIVVHLKKLGNSGKRKVVSIVEVAGIEGDGQIKVNPIFTLDEREQLVLTGTLPRCFSRLQEAGLRDWSEIKQLLAVESFVESA